MSIVVQEDGVEPPTLANLQSIRLAAYLLRIVRYESLTTHKQNK